MSVFAPARTLQESKVHHTQYIKTENKPDEAETTAAEPANPEQPEVS